VRKTVIDPATVHSESRAQQEWLDLEEMAEVEVTSADPRFPLESALVSRRRDRAGGRPTEVSRSFE